MVTAPPTGVPPAVQSGLEAAGPQTKNLTVPVTAPFEPDRVAVSVTDWPSVIWPELAWVVKTAGTGRIAAAFSERSWLPPDPSRSSRRMWYGEPEIAPALLPAPQSIWEAMWPPQATRAVALVAVKLMVTERCSLVSAT